MSTQQEQIYNMVFDIREQVGSIQSSIVALNERLDTHIKADDAVAARVNELEAVKNKQLGAASLLTLIGTGIGSALGFFLSFKK